ncbi:Vps5-domain-containing protein [Athelia psychrophila]|uniref:Vps5-domain-containing protein n=1 Tax=Athelia psychrophila TaxID=1759441 RepID=A0A166NZS9_9AGAM|nr:Vps5-domain-containing protein [Fibularhizoctonia sp. CBS 109695]
MDFDDLLIDPFADPFAKPRSGSPDPWASFSHQKPAEEQHEAFTDSTYEDNRSTTPTTESYATGEHGDSSHSTVADPLESAFVNAEDEEATASVSYARPGFRESISVVDPAEHTQTISEPEPSTSPARTQSPPLATQEPIRQPSPPVAQSPVQSTPSTPPPPQSATSEARSPIVSPLEHAQASSNFNQNFNGLSLGGDSVGGWQSDQGGWASEEPVPPVPSASSAPSVPEDEDDDDDVPIMQSRSKAANISNTTAARNDNGIQPVFVITVDDPQKVSDPILKFTMYTVHTRTTSPMFQKSAFSVLRRYSDFLWLYETLSLSNPGVIVPPVPEKMPFGRFNESFLQSRRQALETCIQKTANHQVLSKDADLKMFLESDSFALDIKQRKAELANQSGGLMASIGQTIAGPRFYETDEWFDRQKAYLDSLESQLRSLVKAIDLVAKQRSELAIARGEFAVAIGDLASCDVEKQLASSLSALADVERKAQDLSSKQSEQDVVTLMSTVDEYSRLINSVRLAFNSRIRTYHAWQGADAEVRRVKQNHERAREQGKIPPDRLGHSLAVMADAERRASDAKHEYDHCSKLIKTEFARFEQERIEDFKDSLEAFLEGMISRQKELIAAWEHYQGLLLKRVGPQGERGRSSIPS